MRNFSLRWKIVLPTVLIIVVAITCLSISIFTQYYDNYSKIALEAAADKGLYAGANVKTIVDSYEQIAKNTADKFEFLLAQTNFTRDSILDFLKESIDTISAYNNTEDWKLIWLMCEPGVVDNNDTLYSNTKGDENGVFTP